MSASQHQIRGVLETSHSEIQEAGELQVKSNSSGDDVQRRFFYDQLQSSTQKSKQEREQKLKRLRELKERHARTWRCLLLVIEGDEKHPTATGPINHAGVKEPRVLVIPSSIWARRILEFADAWKSHPGETAIEHDSMHGAAGFKAAERVFQRALNGASRVEIEREIDMARSSLDPFKPTFWNECDKDTQVGMIGFFRQLQKLLELDGSLPRTTKPERTSAGHKRPGLPQKTGEHPNDPTGKTETESDLDYVTLDRAAALVRRSKKRLANLKSEDSAFPSPDVTGGGGKPNEWLWSRLRPYLEKRFDRRLPEKLLLFH